MPDDKKPQRQLPPSLIARLNQALGVSVDASIEDIERALGDETEREQQLEEPSAEQ